ncbi:hypothetical protein C3Y98_12520 [Methylotenera oryzisoli]|jgi:hypothetical protein|uniref:Lipoprotein n=1 Tax=Methylotenera oryzisoli TaxID=2080758 RepID=A0A4Y9VMR0_9PROT|nr:hypothetical protein [Methylotenera oryzisoli]TFW69650.1 hypothetical protein C3Y98_12520 [Methylotenera oryzisoli]
MRQNLISLGILLSVSGCATISQGTQQLITFKLEPKEAVCEVSRVGDGKLGSISGKSNIIQVGKDKDDIVVVCNAEGYAQSTTKIVSGATGAGVTGVLLDLGITDMITGAMYRYPEDVTIVLVPETKVSTK